MFNFEHARYCLKVIEEKLVGRLGMRTLSPDDPNYKPYYDPANDSEDSLVAGGANYHNGPEWLWLFGHYVRAKWNFSNKTDVSDLLSFSFQIMP